MTDKAYLQFGQWGGPYQTVALDDYREQLAPRSGVTATGYGARIPTPHMVKYAGRWRRVYAVCYSNVATLYCRVAGERVIVSIQF